MIENSGIMIEGALTHAPNTTLAFLTVVLIFLFAKEIHVFIN